jgi:putative hydrolase of the HAD superfamily
VTVQAVIFDWGGTLTPWHSVDHRALWHTVCAGHFPSAAVADTAAAMLAAEADLWRASETEQRAATLTDLFERAGVTPREGLLAAYFAEWEPHTRTDPEAHGLLAALRTRGIKIGVLSNTMWPRDWHEHIFARDGVLDMIDGAIYSSEFGRTKPHKTAFHAAMNAVGVADPGTCVFVGDRLYDDIEGAKAAGMRAIHIPHSPIPYAGPATPDAVVERLAEIVAVIDAW